MAVRVEGLVKTFGKVPALDGFDLHVERGTVCALLGPNGAGKTTAVRVLATLTLPDAGRAEVLGHDVVREPAAVRRLIGLAGQHAAVDDDLTGRENLEILGRMYHLGRAGARSRAVELLERFGLDGPGHRLVKTWSGGQRRRLDLVASIVVTPPVLFLDEPTTGLDPRSRSEIWDAVRALVAAGTTVLLTTQYLEEADRIADDIVIVNEGKVVSQGSPATLKASIGARAEVHVSDVDGAAEVLGRWATGPPEIDREAGRVAVPVDADSVGVPELVRALDAAGVAVGDVSLRLPTLDQVFLARTGAAA